MSRSSLAAAERCTEVVAGGGAAIGAGAVAKGTAVTGGAEFAAPTVLDLVAAGAGIAGCATFLLLARAAAFSALFAAVRASI